MFQGGLHKKLRFEEEAGQGPSQQSRPEVKVEEEEAPMKRMILYPDGRLSSAPPQGLVGGWKRVWASAEDAKKKWVQPSKYWSPFSPMILYLFIVINSSFGFGYKL